MIPSGKPPRRNLSIAFVFALALSVYLNAIPNGFVVDDLHQVTDNRWITSPSFLPEIFSSGVWDFEGRPSSYYRPVMHVFYMGTYMIFGLKPWAFHLVNILLHGGVTIVVFLLGRNIWTEDDPAGRWYLAPPFVSAVLFAVHPIHTEPVAWVSGLTDILYAFFFILSLILYARSGTDWTFPYFFSLICFLFALLSKEPAATLPVVLFAYEIIFHRRERSWRMILTRLFPFVGVFLLYSGLRIGALGSLAPAVSPVDLSPSEYALTVVVLFSRYMGKLVFPADLNFWHFFKPVSSIYTTEVMTALLVLCICASIIYRVRSDRAGLFACVLTVVPLGPIFIFSRMTQGIENVFTERYLYLASVGFVFLVAGGADWFRRRMPFGTHIGSVILAVIVVMLSIGTLRRNIVWHDSYSLWSDAARKSPESAIARMNHGYALLSRQSTEEGLFELQEAIRLQPTLLADKNAKAVFYAQKGFPKQAVLEFHSILAVKSDYAPARFNLAVLYESRGMIDQAIREYELAVKIQPDYAEAHNNLGIAFGQKGMKEKAIQHLKEAVRLRPTDAVYANNLERAHRLP